MIKKAINLKETSFTQAINISAQWCKEWGEVSFKFIAFFIIFDQNFIMDILKDF